MSKDYSGLFPNTIGGSKYTSTKENIFSDKKTWPSTLDKGKQGKHIPSHKNFVPGKSELTISMKEAKDLAKKFSGTGKVKGPNKENVDFGKTIGNYVDPATGKKIPTSKGTIHHSKKGTHIVPARP